MHPIRRATIRERGRAALAAGLIYWLGITLAFGVFGILGKPRRGPREFIGVAGVSWSGRCCLDWSCRPFIR